MDLDNFKYVNDSLGHEAGDELLVAVAGRLQRRLRPADTTARLGRDEFTVLLEDIADAEVAAGVAERIAAELADPLRLDDGAAGREVFATASMGIALSFDGAGVRGRGVDLLKDADAAMYEAKKRGRDRYEFFRSGLGLEASARLGIKSDLRRALERGEFRLHYQPKVTLEDGRVVGVEALARWEHPRDGTVSPAKFIPVAEETGLIVPLGRWVVGEACRQATEWRDRYRRRGGRAARRPRRSGSTSPRGSSGTRASSRGSPTPWARRAWPGRAWGSRSPRAPLWSTAPVLSPSSPGSGSWGCAWP